MVSAENRPICEWTYRDIQTLPPDQQKEWRKVCTTELDMLKQRDVFELVNMLKGCKVNNNHWVFDVKPDGCKHTCLVVKGFSQVKGIDFGQVFSPVIQFETVHLMLALASIENWHIEGLDVRSTYVYGKLDEEIYMKQPKGFAVKGQEHKVLCLKRALYSLKQAGLAWWETLNESMKDLGFKRLKSDAGIFLYKRKGTTTVVAIVYVDDAPFCGPDIKTIKEIKAAFMKHWECRD